MRWKSNTELPDWAVVSFIAVMSPLLIIGAASLFLTFGGFWLKRRLLGPSKDWSWWFAWHPICRNVDNEYDERVWLEWVERRSGGLLTHNTQYRARYTSQVPA